MLFDGKFFTRINQPQEIIGYTQSHYIEVTQGDIFMEQKNVIGAGFGPIGNTENKSLGRL